MKKSLLFAVFMIVMGVEGAHCAYEKCVPAGVTFWAAACDIDLPGEYAVEWSGTCSGTAVKGISACVLGGVGTQSVWGGYPNIKQSSTVAENRTCACKLLSPAVSYWVGITSTSPIASVIGGSIASVATCQQFCANACAAALSAQSGTTGYSLGRSMRTAMFNGTLSQ